MLQAPALGGILRGVRGILKCASLGRIMTIQKHLFPAEFMKANGNATTAAIACGCSAKAAGSRGYQLRHEVLIAAEIERLLKERVDNTKVTCESLLLHLDAMKNADPADILSFDGLTILPLRQWPLIWRQSLNGLEFIEELGKGGQPVGFLKKIKWISRERVLEMIGKHTSINAFNRKELTGLNGTPLEVNATPTLSQDEAQKLLQQQAQNNAG